MALFAILCKDKPGALETRLATRPVHLDYLTQSKGLKLAGALLGDDGNPIGSLLIVALAFNVMGLTKIRVMNSVPAVFFPILLCGFF